MRQTTDDLVRYAEALEASGVKLGRKSRGQMRADWEVAQWRGFWWETGITAAAVVFAAYTQTFVIPAIAFGVVVTFLRWMDLTERIYL